MNTLTVYLKPVAQAVAVCCRGLYIPLPMMSVPAAYGAGALVLVEKRMRRDQPGRTLV